MTILQGRFAMRSLGVAVQAALAALAFAPVIASAEDDEVTALTQRSSSVEVGALNVSDDSAKFGEYTGLDKKGGYFIGNFQLFGRGDESSAYRWALTGTNLGLDSRSLQGEAGKQGRWRVTFGYDQLPRNYTDEYMSLWRGSGSSGLALPAGYPAASTRLSATGNAAGLLSNWNNIQAPNGTATSTGGGPAYVIPASLERTDVGTERKRADAGVSVVLGGGWEFRAGVKREEKDGTKLTGVNIGRFAGVSALLPEPISSTTDQFEAAFAFAGKQGHFNVGYYGSLYRNDIGLWTVENPGANNAVLNNVARLQSYPDNQMHQLNFSGGWKFSDTTRLLFSGAWSRMTQDDEFIANPAGSTWVVPETSAHAKVVTANLLARLTSQVTKDVSLLAAFRYDDRKNKTPIEEFFTTGGDTAGASTQFENEPINRRLQQVNLEADYRLGRGQGVRGEYEWQEIKRSSTAEESPFRADRTRENTLRAVYRNSQWEDVNARIAYAYSQRRVSEYIPGDPRPSNPPPPQPAADPLLAGFEQFFLADRDRHKLRSSIGFQASETLSLQATLDYNRDTYPSSQYGMKESKSWVFGADGALVASDRLTLNVFYTYEDMKMQLDSLAIARGLTSTTLVPHVSGPPCAAYTNVAGTLPDDYYTDPCRQWTATQGDKIHTLGVGARYRGMLGGRLDLSGELAYSKAKTPIAVMGGTYYNTAVPNSPTGNVFVAAESFQDITSEFTQLRLAGTYAIDKRSAVRVTYIYGRLKSSDWAYDSYAQSVLGVLAVQNFVGPGLTSPDYNVNVIGISYILSFR